MNNFLIDVTSFTQVVREFIRALGQKRTYALFKNVYCLFGILWGIPVPIVTIGLNLHVAQLPANMANILSIIRQEPQHYFFLMHPLFFAVVFGAMGTVRYNKQTRIEEFERNLLNKNAELEYINKKLQELDKLKSNFLSMVSHELRTPLVTIQGYLSFLLNEKSGAINQTQRESLKIAEETADLLKRLIEELLDLSKIERGEFKVGLEPVDMATLVQKTITALHLYADERGIKLENHLPKELPAVWTDKERILQVTTNLMENAIKFNRKGGLVSISAAEDQARQRVVFCVSDTGIGIPVDKLDKVFDKFYQVDNAGGRKYGGCGLGLAISKNIVERHQGRIWVESTEGIGSRFYFELLTTRPTADPCACVLSLRDKI